MKLKYEIRTKAIGDAVMPGNGGWWDYSTGAKTRDGLLKVMCAQAEKALARRMAFYVDSAPARKMDKFDLPHVWHFHTYAPFENSTLRFDAFAVVRDGECSEIESTWAIYGRGTRGQNWEEFEGVKRKYEELCAA